MVEALAPTTEIVAEIPAEEPGHAQAPPLRDVDELMGDEQGPPPGITGERLGRDVDTPWEGHARHRSTPRRPHRPGSEPDHDLVDGDETQPGRHDPGVEPTGPQEG